MKKLLSLLIVILMLVTPACADTELTDKVGVFEFCELYGMRLTRLNKIMGVELECHIHSDFIYPSFGSDTAWSASTAAGLFEFDTEDFDIISWIGTVMDVGDDVSQSTNDSNYYSVCAAVSALEFDSLSADLMENYSKFDPDYPSDPILGAMDILVDEIMVNLEDSHILSSLIDGEELLVYEGNYSYYLSYSSFEYNGRTTDAIYLTARARENSGISKSK